MDKIQSAYEMFDVLYDILEEYEHDTSEHEKCGMDTRYQRDFIIRAREALNNFSPGCITKPLYWEE
jgi:hypothetical protein